VPESVDTDWAKEVLSWWIEHGDAGGKLFYKDSGRRYFDPVVTEAEAYHR
jgi:hypothetical protein